MGHVIPLIIFGENMSRLSVFGLTVTFVVLAAVTVLSWDMVGFDVSVLLRSRLIIWIAALKIILIASEFMGLRKAHWAFLTTFVIWSTVMATALSFLLNPAVANAMP